MINFWTDWLSALAGFLMQPPIFYLYVLILACFIAKFVRILGKY